MLTIGRIVIVLEGGDEVAAIVSEVTGATCCVTAFRPRCAPVPIYDLPWFETREKAFAHRGASSVQNEKVAYLPYHLTGAPLVSLEQVTDELKSNDRKIAALLTPATPAFPETPEDWARARPDLQDHERGRTLPPITGRLNVPLGIIGLK